jgi:hypothetical protein
MNSMTTEPMYEALDNRLFPEEVELYRFDMDHRVEQGIKTARTILTGEDGRVMTFGFKNRDITSHLRSSYESRLQKRHETTSSAGSPFVSASLRVPFLMLKGMIDRGELHGSSLFRLNVDRTRVIVPRQHGLYGVDESKMGIFEVLIVGDVARDDMELLGPASNYLKKPLMPPAVSSPSFAKRQGAPVGLGQKYFAHTQTYLSSREEQLVNTPTRPYDPANIEHGFEIA